MWKGKTENYNWVVSINGFTNLLESLLKTHANQLLHITAFDSGPISPMEEEIQLDWYVKGEVMISPPLNKTISVPYEQYDEWYISHSELNFPNELEIFVNYGGFNLASPDELTKDDDPTWERGRCDFLYPLQEKFWYQLKQVNPETYVAIGDHDIIVSKNENFINKIEEYT